tara:strand:- start:126 stop:836 length:711 start_codon:yes stop_codon:yes gene_type:complete
MNLLNFLKRFLFVQNFAASIISSIHSYLDLTLFKYQAIKKAMFITAHDETYGSYVEFGIFTGSSFNFSMKINKKIEKIFGNSKCDFFGFDSFNGFGKINEEDNHPRFQDNIFSVDEKKILKNINKCSGGQSYKIIKGFYKETLKNKIPQNYGIKKARVIMIDCDLKEATELALNFLKSVLQKGTIIMFDDYIYYKGSETKGEYGAFKKFREENSNFKFREAFDYGYGSKAFIVTEI